MTGRAAVRAIGLVPALLLAAGCASSGPHDGPRAAANFFEASWARHDGAAVCRVLAPQARAAVSQSARKPCAAGILDEDLPTSGPPGTTRVWGRAAQVQVPGDTLFLSRFPSGWKVIAAGCTPLAGKLYDCQVQGG